MKHKIFNIKFDELIKVDTLFDEEQGNNENVTYVSKELYHHEDENDEGAFLVYTYMGTRSRTLNEQGLRIAQEGSLLIFILLI